MNKKIQILFEQHRDRGFVGFVVYILDDWSGRDEPFIRDAQDGWIPNSECQANAHLYAHPEDAIDDVVNYLEAWKEGRQQKREEEDLEQLRKQARKKIRDVLSSEEIEALGVLDMNEVL